jgi:oligopeptide transport system substrate-binding protein
MFENLRPTVVSLLCALAILGAGCSPTAAPTAPPSIAAAAQLTRVPQPALAANQVLRIPIAAEPATIDPQKSAGSINLQIVMLVFENLLTYDVNGKLIPAVAAALPAVSADGRVYTFKLRDGLKYSDGQPLTARDFEFGWKRSLDPTIGYGYAFSGYIIKGGLAYNRADPLKVSKEELQKLRDAVGVKALDDKTLEFTLERPAAYFPNLVAIWTGLPTRQDMIEKGGAKWTEPPTYIGNGPYVLKEWEHGVKFVFEPNPNYRTGAPTIRRIERIIVERSTFMGYQNNELDAMWVDPEVLTAMQNNAELKQQSVPVPQPGTSMLVFGISRKPFDNVQVRRTFSMAIDRNALVNGVDKGMGIAAEQLVPPGVPGHYPDLKTLKFDPVAARKLLAEAGYPGGKGLPEITLTHLAGERVYAEFLQAQLKEHLGVEIKLDPMDSKARSPLLRSPDTYPQLIFMPGGGWHQDYPDPQDWYSIIFHSKATAWARNYWNNVEFDKLTEQADAEVDAAKRDALYKQAAQILMDDAPVVYLEHMVSAALIKPWVKGCKPHALDLFFLCRGSIMQMYIEQH